MRHVGIVSLEADLHAHAVAKCLREHFRCPVSFFAVDEAHKSSSLSWSFYGNVLSDYSDTKVSLEELDVVWWRRANQSQAQSELLVDPIAHAFASAEWRFAYAGIWSACFKGMWVNDPRSEMWATSKQIQLLTAKRVGFEVPETIISNDPETVRMFSQNLDGNIVVKKISGVSGASLATVHLDVSTASDASIKLAPAVYQKRISARVHYRVMAFGRNPVFVEIVSDEMDWRRGFNAKPRKVSVDSNLEKMVNDLLDELRLEMGIIDLVIDQKGSVIFLEVNTQGQFLFLEGLGQIDLTVSCAEFLANHTSSNFR